MKTKAARILSLMLVAGLLIAIPASTQIFGSRIGSEEGDVDLGMLVTVNRLELSEDQMVELKDLIDGLLSEKDALDVARAQFEEEMIAFNGSSEELDERLTTFRESQAEAMTALQGAAAEALDSAKDLLSINQGEVIQEALMSRVGFQAMSAARQNEMLGQVGGNRGQGTGMRGRMQGQIAERMMGERMQGMSQRMGRESGQGELLLELREQRGGQVRGTEAPHEDMLGAIKERLEAFEGELPEALLDRLEMLEERASEEFSGRFGDGEFEFGEGLQGRAGRMAMGMMAMRGSQSLQGSSLGMRQGMGSGQLFEVLEQLSEILELKLEALQ